MLTFIISCLPWEIKRKESTVNGITFSGTVYVTSHADYPASFAKITLKPLNYRNGGLSIYHTITNKNGEFEFFAIPPGRYSVKAIAHIDQYVRDRLFKKYGLRLEERLETTFLIDIKKTYKISFGLVNDP
jgi:hypothetical protein